MTKSLLSQMIIALTPVLVPILVMLLKKGMGALPTWTIPMTAVVLGFLIDQINGYVTGANLGGVWGAVLGAAGVGVREVLDQVRSGLKS